MPVEVAAQLRARILELSLKMSYDGEEPEKVLKRAESFAAWVFSGA